MTHQQSGAMLSRPGRAYWEIHCLVPDLPGADDLLPYLREIDGNRWYTNFGPLVGRYEAALAAFCGAADAHAVTCASGTAALTLALRALALPQNARVLLPALTFPATLLSVVEAGLTPVLADVDSGTWMLEPAIARAALEAGPVAAVVPVAAFGYPIAPDPWAAFRAETGVPVILDAAAALGVQSLPAGADLPAVFSLHATKPLGVGEGGVLLTRDEGFAARVRRLSNFGFDRWIVREPGSNAKLSEYHAAVGLAQLARAETLRRRRGAVHAQYRAQLPARYFRSAPSGQQDSTPAVLPLRTGHRAETVMAHMDTRRIETRRWYSPPLHRHEAFEGVARVGALDQAQDLGRTLIGIPFHNFLGERDVQRVVTALQELPEAL